MAKLLFQIPTGQKERSDESSVNASFAMLGVIAIISIISLVFLFQHALSVPYFGGQGALVKQAENLCGPDGSITEGGYVDELRANGFKCWRVKNQLGLSCCYKL